MIKSWPNSNRQLAINLLLDTQFTTVRDHLVHTKLGLYITSAAEAHDKVVTKLKTSAHYSIYYCTRSLSTY